MIEFRPFDRLKPLRLSIVEDIEDGVHGIYGFWYDQTCVYIGKAKDQPIKSRLIQHWRGSHNRQLRDWMDAEGQNIGFAYLEISDTDAVDCHERYYIRRFQPMSNSIMGISKNVAFGDSIHI